MLMFTYGTLKDPLRLEQDGAIITVENAVVQGFKMYSNKGFFPITKRTGNTNDVIYGTLFFIPKHVITQYYDRIEGYIPGRDPKLNMYNREKVNVSVNGRQVEAEMYVANEDMFEELYEDSNLVESGNWDDVGKRCRVYDWEW